MTEQDTTVLVTGANGFLGTHITAALLARGYAVRAAVRAPERGAELRRDLQHAGVEALERLDVVHARLDDDSGWPDATRGARYVLHTASPFPAGTPGHEDELIVPARDGALRVLRAARDAGVERVVLTSSFAAVGYSRKDDPTFTEEDWTDPDDELQPYIKSKVIAERAAWDFIAAEGGGLQLSVINPVGIFGPAWGPKLSTSVAFVRMMLDGTLAAVPDQHFGVVDVRDVADLHVRAMTDAAAAGERFLAVADGPSVSFLEVAQLLREELGPLAERVPQTQTTTSSDGSDPAVIPVISNAKATSMLGWHPRPVRETVRDTARSLFDLGIVPSTQPSA
jgi:nucleoside-diphosphate-sugar epimerase